LNKSLLNLCYSVLQGFLKERRQQGSSKGHHLCRSSYCWLRGQRRMWLSIIWFWCIIAYIYLSENYSNKTIMINNESHKWSRVFFHFLEFILGFFLREVFLKDLFLFPFLVNPNVFLFVSRENSVSCTLSLISQRTIKLKNYCWWKKNVDVLDSFLFSYSFLGTKHTFFFVYCAFVAIMFNKWGSASWIWLFFPFLFY